MEKQHVNNHKHNNNNSSGSKAASLDAVEDDLGR